MSIGTEWEVEFAGLTGAKLTPGSGNKPFASMDGEHLGRLLWSCKATDRRTFTLDDALFEECDREANLRGGGVMPAWAIHIRPIRRRVVMFDVPTWLGQVEEDVKLVRPDKGAVKRAAASVPSLLRDNE